MVQPPPWPTQKRYVGVPGQVALPVTVMVAPGGWGEGGRGGGACGAAVEGVLYVFPAPEDPPPPRLGGGGEGGAPKPGAGEDQRAGGSARRETPPPAGPRAQTAPARHDRRPRRE